ncbi:MAG: hypothetical protein GC164_10905 [Phycisphaera sp.]|nr:hypothetical protein [Phycisphaera sp.]
MWNRRRRRWERWNAKARRVFNRRKLSRQQRSKPIDGLSNPTFSHADCQIETLEPRLLLTTLIGGDSFEYVAANGDIIRVTTTGDLIAELIASDIDDLNQLLLGDMPGVITSSDLTGRSGASSRGGLGGQDGVEGVGTTDITDVENDAANALNLDELDITQSFTAASANINVTAIASQSAANGGHIYGFNLGNGSIANSARPLIQLVEFDTPDSFGTTDTSANAQVEAVVHQATLREDRPAALSTALGNVEAFAVNPVNGQAYAIIENESAGSQIVSVDTATGAVGAAATITNTSDGAALRNVKAMAFNSSGTLFILTQDYDPTNVPDPDIVDQNVNEAALVRISNPATATFTDDDVQLILDNGQQFHDDFTAMTFQTIAGKQNVGALFAVSRVVAQDGTNTDTLRRMTVLPFAGGAFEQINLSTVGVITGLDIEGLAVSLDINNNLLLVGVDHSLVNNQTSLISARLVSMSFVDASTKLLDQAGMVSPVKGLSSYINPGDTRPLLYSTDGTSVILGSTIKLPTDDTTGATTIGDIVGADFNPDDGLLYFVADDGTNNDGLYTIDVSAGSRARIQNSLTLKATINRKDVNAIAFDVNGGNALYGFGTAGQLFTINTANGTTAGAIAVSLKGATVTDIDSMVAIPGRSGFFFGVQGSGADALLVRIRISTGTLYVLGPMPETKTGARGQHVRGITYNPVLTDPFSGGTGVLVGSDVGTDELLYIDPTPRFPEADLFQIYLTQGSLDDNSGIFISQITAAGKGMIPYTGNAGTLRILPGQGNGSTADDGRVDITGPTGVGSLYIGARTENTTAARINAGDPRPNIPYFYGTTATDYSGGQLIQFNTRGRLVDDVSEDTGITDYDVFSGVRMTSSLMRYVSTNIGSAYTVNDRVIDDFFARVNNVSIARNGVIYALDSDGTDQFGASTTSDQLAILSSTDGTGTILLSVTDPLNGNSGLLGAQAMDFGDLNFDGVEELYAIYDKSGTPTLGVIGGTGSFKSQRALGGGITGVKAMAFTSSQKLYIVDDQNRLIQINPNTGAVISVIGTVVDNTGSTLDIASMDFDATGRLLAHDRSHGRLVNINLTTAVAGATVQTTDGSLRTSVGAISYNRATNSWYAVDNAFGALEIGHTGLASSALFKLNGVTTLTEDPQNLAKAFFGGTVTGIVDISGSVDTFYAGWLITGKSDGMTGLFTSPYNGFTPTQTAPTSTYYNTPLYNNFHIGGDLRNLATLQTIGGNSASTSTVFQTGTEIQVGGRAGWVHTIGSNISQIDVVNNASSKLGPLNYLDTEFEYRLNPGESEGSAFERGHIADAATANLSVNDSFDTPQILGVMSTAVGAPATGYSLVGQLNGFVSDDVDYYGVSLMAGQTVTVQLITIQPPPFLQVGIIDPDGRLIATDYSNYDGSYTNQAFQFTADRPGLYRVAVAWPGDVNFNGSADAGESVTRVLGPFPYYLQLSGLGNVALGGYQTGDTADDTWFHDSTDAAILVQKGDLGAVWTAGSMSARLEYNAAFQPADRIRTDAGTIRAVMADQFGRSLSNGMVLSALGGSVGIAEAFTGDSYWYRFHSDVDVQALDAYAAGEGQTMLMLDLSAGRGVGTIRAGNMAATSAFKITVNSDLVGNDGFVDLIDVLGQMGTSAGGGPQITTGPGGNVRYIHAGGLMYQDSLFGSSLPIQPTILNEGQAIQLVDDSGGRFTLTPIGTPNPDYDQNVYGSQKFLPTQLSYMTYGIRGSGGSVLLNVTGTGGVKVDTSTLQTSQHVEISQAILPTEGGKPVETDETTGNVALSTTSTEDDIYFFVYGAKTDVYKITGGQFSSIENNTLGEIITVDAVSTGKIVAGSLGIAKSTAGGVILTQDTDVTGNAIANAFPFLQQTNGIMFSGNVGEMYATGALGNIMVGGDVNTIAADLDKKPNTTGSFDGITAPVYVEGLVNKIDIGAGLPSSGTGEFEKTGLYVVGQLGTVINTGLGSDIRGHVVSQTGIGSINLNNGAIIDTDIAVIPDFTGVSELYSAAFGLPQDENPYFPTFDIGSINLSGKGGIIGTNITAPDIGPITLSNGSFGLIEANFVVANQGTIGDVTVDGYGLRTVSFNGGAVQRNITATNLTGASLPATNFTTSVRQSRNQTYDPFSGRLLTFPNDLHAWLGTSEAMPSIPPVTTAGVIEDVVAYASQDLGNVTAYLIRATNPLAPVSFNFANKIGTIKTTSTINDLKVVTGSLAGFLPGASVYGLDLTVSGPITSIYINGDLGNDSSISAIGPDGTIFDVTVTGNFDGTIFATNAIKNLIVGGNFVGLLTINGAKLLAGNLALSYFKVSGNYFGTATILGNVGTVEVRKTMGLSASDTFNVTGNLNSLIVGNDTTSNGDALVLTLTVTGDVGSVNVTGEVRGDIFVGGNLLNLIVAKDALSSASLLQGIIDVGNSLSNAAISGGNIVGGIHVGNQLGALALTNGHIASGILVGDRIGSVVVTNGNVTTAGSIVSAFGNIELVKIINGDLFGPVKAMQGNILRLEVASGSDIGDGSTPLEILADSLGVLIVAGIIKGGVTFNIAGELTQAIVGSVAYGATINAGSVSSFTTVGNYAGDATWGYRTTPTFLTVGGNLGTSGTTVSINANSVVKVSGSTVAGSTLSVGRDLNELRVTGALASNVLVDGAAKLITAGSVSSAKIITGLDLVNLTVSGAMTAGLVQVGASRNDANEYAQSLRRRGKLTTFDVGSMVNSVVSAGGDVVTAVIRGAMTNSSLTSGLVLNGNRLDDVLDGTLSLASSSDRNTLRGGATLFNGLMSSVSITGAMTGSSVVAGVSPGDDGSFNDAVAGSSADLNNVKSSVTGGRSYINDIVAAVGAGSFVIADTGFVSNRTTLAGGTVIANVAYSFATQDISSNNPIEPLVGTAVQGSPVTYGGITVTVTGTGSVQVRDDVLAGNVVDTLILVGTNPNTQVVVTSTTPGAVSIGRVLSTDDISLSKFSFDGDIIGDGTADPDIWIDGPVTTFAVRDIGNNADGKIGGNVGTFQLRTLGSGTFVVGGSIATAILQQGNRAGLTVAEGASSTANISLLASDSIGQTWVFDSVAKTLRQVNPVTGADLTAPVSVTDEATGSAITLSGLDFDSVGNLFATASVFDQSPTTVIGSLAVAGLNITASTDDRNGNILAIDSSTGTDRLIRINGSTAAVTVLGNLEDIFGQSYSGNFQALTTSPDGTKLFGIVNDRDGTGTTYTSANGAALVQVELGDVNNNGVVEVSSPSSLFFPGVLINGGGVTNTYVAMTRHPSLSDRFYAIERVGGQDILVRLQFGGSGASTVVTRTVLGTVKVGGVDTNIVGLGYYAGNLVALNKTGATAELIKFTAPAPGSATRITAANALSGDLDQFVVGATGRTLAIDNAGSGTLYASAGLAEVLGSLNTTTGVFTRVKTLAKDTSGLPITSSVRGFTIDTATDHAYVATSTGKLYEYDTADGSLVGAGAIGTLTDASSGVALTLRALSYDNTNGRLLGLDSRLSTVVMIDTTTAQGSAILPGSFDTTILNGLDFNDTTGTLRSFNDSTDHFTRYRISGTDQAGLIADSYNALQITGGGDFAGRVEATGNTFNTVTVAGSFSGELVTQGSINSYAQTGGNFSGVMQAAGDLVSVTITGGSVLTGALIQAGGTLKNFSMPTASTAMNGRVVAEYAETFNIKGNLGMMGELLVNGYASSVSVASLLGHVTLGSAGSIVVSGSLARDSSLTVNGATNFVSVTVGAAVTSVMNFFGPVATLKVLGTINGEIYATNGVTTAQLGNLAYALIVVGENLTNFSATSMTGSVVSVGTTVGADGVYNTDDDEITGGTISAATVSGVFNGSAIVAGVLPTAVAGTGRPTSNLYYTGSPGNPDLNKTDSAEAGGILPSRIDQLSVLGNVNGIGLGSVVAAADTIKNLTGPTVGLITTRAYGDPLGAPQVIYTTFTSASQVQSVFTEELISNSFVLAQDNNGDGDVDDVGDTPGSVLVVDDQGNVLNNLTLSYSTTTDANGKVLGVLTITSPTDFTAEFLEITLSGNLTAPTIVDRTGLRSAQRDWNRDGTQDAGEDARGTILDGDKDGVEGGSYVVRIGNTDQPDSFEDVRDLVGNEQPIVLDGPIFTFTANFENDSDIDIFRIDGIAGQYLGAGITSTESFTGKMGIFFRDTQGTLATGDDYFDLVITWDSFSNQDFQGIELPDSGEYYVVFVATGITEAGQGYEAQFALSSTDTGLATVFDGTINGVNLNFNPGSPYDDVTIGYVNNTKNIPSQLVYVNFNGGTATQYKANYGVDVPVSAFDASNIAPGFGGHEDELINGGVGFTGIIDNMIDIYSNFTSQYGSFTVDRLLASDLSSLSGDIGNLASGLHFTTVDPALYGLDPTTDYTTLYIGGADDAIFLGYPGGLLGIASNIDVGHMEYSNEAIIFEATFAYLGIPSLEGAAIAIANTAAHELGHTMGLNHTEQLTLTDVFNSVPVGSYQLMSAGQNSGSFERYTYLRRLGVSDIETDEFPIGWIDTAAMLTWWLS